MNEIFEILPGKERQKLRKKRQPGWTGPMLATLTDEPFSRENWIFERKLDGERCLAFKKGRTARLMSRNRKELNHHYPEIAEAIREQSRDFVADGEIVAFDGNVTSFSRLQPRMQSKKPDMEVEVWYYLFDIIHLDEYDLSGIGLRYRKSLLKEAIDFGGGNLRYSAHRNREGEKYLEEACAKKWEGIIAKDADSGYIHKRSGKWLKFKCENRQELVICGYTDPKGSRKHFGALIVGFYEEGRLIHAGKVGTGYDEETLKRVHGKMKPMERETNPFDGGDPGYSDAHWLEPEIVGEFRFTEWTEDHRLRHPSFLGLREDKDAREVRKEQ